MKLREIERVAMRLSLMREAKDEMANPKEVLEVLREAHVFLSKFRGTHDFDVAAKALANLIVVFTTA